MKKRGIALCLAFAVIAIATGIAHGRKQSEKQFVLDFEKIRAVTNATDWELLSRHHEHDLAIGTQTVSTQRIVAVCRNQDTGTTRPKFFHDSVTRLLIHISMHGTHGKMFGAQLFGQPIHLGFGIAKNDGLGNRRY